MVKKHEYAQEREVYIKRTVIIIIIIVITYVVCHYE
jgi:hypothetical protein